MTELELSCVRKKAHMSACGVCHNDKHHAGILSIRSRPAKSMLRISHDLLLVAQAVRNSSIV